MNQRTLNSKGKAGVLLAVLLAVPVLLIGLVIGVVAWANQANGELLTETLAEPLNGLTTAKIDIDPGDGNLTIDGLTGGEPLLAGGELQYREKQGLPTRSLVALGAEATFSLAASEGKQAFAGLPWAACNGATEWRIHLNPGVLTDLNAHTDGGNLTLALAGLAISRVAAETSGGNVEVVLPDRAADLSVTAISGAGNVLVRVPEGMAALIHITTGMGKVSVDPRFSQVDDSTYRSNDYDSAANRVEITLHSGAGNVSVETK